MNDRVIKITRVARKRQSAYSVHRSGSITGKNANQAQTPVTDQFKTSNYTNTKDGLNADLFNLNGRRITKRIEYRKNNSGQLFRKIEIFRYGADGNLVSTTGDFIDGIKTKYKAPTGAWVTITSGNLNPSVKSDFENIDDVLAFAQTGNGYVNQIMEEWSTIGVPLGHSNSASATGRLEAVLADDWQANLTVLPTAPDQYKSSYSRALQ